MEKMVKPEEEIQGDKALLVVHQLLNNRLETIPWHVSNVGVDVEELRTWEHRSLLHLLQNSRGEILCAYDTLGILTHLCLTMNLPAVYHSVRDFYSFPQSPVRKIICDPLNMPPKHRLFYESRYGTIASTFLFAQPKFQDSKTYTFLGTLKRLLKPGGRFVVSYTGEDNSELLAAAESLSLCITDTITQPDVKGVCGVVALETL